ncbi:hypothetical protein [Bradyrhizobium sp. UFLA05-112]
MIDHRPRPNLRIVEGRKPSVLNDGSAVLEFTQIKVVGIIDSESGLITGLSRRRPEPAK